VREYIVDDAALLDGMIQYPEGCIGSGMTRADAAAAALALRSAFSCRTARLRSRALSSSEAVKGSAGPSARGKQLMTVLKQVNILTTCATHID
jgi:hypothetical protein